FPTRRSSDLAIERLELACRRHADWAGQHDQLPDILRSLFGEKAGESTAEAVADQTRLAAMARHDLVESLLEPVKGLIGRAEIDAEPPAVDRIAAPDQEARERLHVALAAQEARYQQHRMAVAARRAAMQ